MFVGCGIPYFSCKCTGYSLPFCKTNLGNFLPTKQSPIFWGLFLNASKYSLPPKGNGKVFCTYGLQLFSKKYNY